jgi:diacylglycerol kinase family enzyme
MPPSGSITVILNPRAGAATGPAQSGTDVAELFRAAGHDTEVLALSGTDNPCAKARIASTHASIVVACGGDGTVSGVAAGLCGSPAALGILPAGTLNHFAKDLNIPLDLGEAIAVVAAGRVKQVDVGQLNDRIFVNNSSIGIYPSIVDEREALRRQGHRKWPAMVLATLRVLRRHRGVTVSIDVGGQRRRWRSPFVFVGNNRYATDGRVMGTRARLDEGQLFVYLTPRLRARDLPRLLAKALVGRASRSGDFEIVQAKELWIDTVGGGRIRVAVDGEIVTMDTPLHYQSRPAALAVVVPQT